MTTGAMNRAIEAALSAASFQKDMSSAVSAFKTSLHGAGFLVATQNPRVTGWRAGAMAMREAAAQRVDHDWFSAAGIIRAMPLPKAPQ